jgi:hypothetical protein
MRAKRHDAGLDVNDTLVAQWETTGNDWLSLYKYTSDRFGIVYSYTGTGCGGGLNCNPDLDPAIHGPIPTGDDDAIAQMERPWGGDNRPGAGPAFVMKCDRKSLARVF